jgi:lysozyme family protein
MAALFKIAFDKLIPVEGGYANNPLDNGGETYKGIARKSHPAWLGWKIIDALRKEPGFPRNLKNNTNLQVQVESFYQVEFWDKIPGSSIAHQKIADELFDSSVNFGIKPAVGFVQKALNILNKNQKLYADITVDGVMGSTTIGLINATEDVDSLLRGMNSYQAAHYIKICEANPSQEEFFRGWIKRAAFQ